MDIKKRFYTASILTLSALLATAVLNLAFREPMAISISAEHGYIKWAEYDIPSGALKKAMKIDIETYKSENHVSWIELLAVLGTKYGGNWKSYRQADIDKIAERLKAGETGAEILSGNKYFDYYYEVYHAVLSGFLGEYQKDITDRRRGLVIPVDEYGLKAFSPIAEGFSFSHYRDFGNSRSYGYSRRHLGNDLCGSVGTPITAVEAGVVEEIGWNRYGGWRVGIRSFDSRRYYYYAHLRKGHPYAPGLEYGAEVQAGDVIGYLGMTGYSIKEDVNNMKIPHLHFGIQLIFDESQKDGENEIWIDVYDLVELLQQNRATVIRDKGSKDYRRRYPMYDENFPRQLEAAATSWLAWADDKIVARKQVQP